MDGYDWPDWITQNGSTLNAGGDVASGHCPLGTSFIEFTALLPAISTGDSHPVGYVWDAADCRIEPAQ